MADPRFPIGKFQYSGSSSESARKQFIDEIAAAPAQLRAAVRGLSPEQLDTPYRQGGWTVRQVVHHVPDSHLNSYVRFKLALTEEQPTIKGYDEGRWAQLADTRTTPVEISLSLLECLHQRWTNLLRSLNASDWKRAFQHPERGLVTLDEALAMYAWHGKHHVAHITRLHEAKGWD